MRCCCEVQAHLGAGHYEGSVEHQPGEEARVPEHGSEGDHAAHAVAHQEEGQLPVLVLGTNNSESISCAQTCKCNNGRKLPAATDYRLLSLLR